MFHLFKNRFTMSHRPPSRPWQDRNRKSFRATLRPTHPFLGGEASEPSAKRPEGPDRLGLDRCGAGPTTGDAVSHGRMVGAVGLKWMWLKERRPWTPPKDAEHLRYSVFCNVLHVSCSLQCVWGGVIFQSIVKCHDTPLRSRQG